MSLRSHGQLIVSIVDCCFCLYSSRTERQLLLLMSFIHSFRYNGRLIVSWGCMQVFLLSLFIPKPCEFIQRMGLKRSPFITVPQSSFFLVSTLRLTMECQYDLSPADCTRAKRPAVFFSLQECKEQRRTRSTKRYYVTPSSMTSLYGSNFWRYLPHLVKVKVVEYAFRFWVRSVGLRPPSWIPFCHVG